MHTGLATLINIMECLDQGVLTDDVCAVMRASFNRYIDGQCGLEEALGLNAAPGKRKPVTQYRELRRNQNLYDAWLHVAGDEVAHPWDRSKLLHDAINRFQVGRWRSWKHFDCPPSNDPLTSAMFYALKLGNIPGTAQGIHNCITKMQ